MRIRERYFLAILVALAVCFGVNPNLYAADDAEKEKAAQEAWLSAFDTYVADSQDTSVVDGWKQYYQQYQQTANAPRALYMVG